MTEKETIERKIKLKWQYYELLEAERDKTYREILLLMGQKSRIGQDNDLCKSEV